MACYNPIGTYNSTGEQVYRPCGYCIGCRLEYARSWAVRCVHEASFHEENCFVTLTYNPENLPSDKSLKKNHIQKFIKKLRRKIEPTKIRYFGCGEYGERFSRPHYHLCIFGYIFKDLELLRSGDQTRFRNRFKTGNTNNLYNSEDLSNTWKKGFVSIGDITFESAGYTARYITKKVVQTERDKKKSGIDKEKLHYKKREKEFAIMSRRPGIGSDWIEKYLSDVYPKDFHTLSGIKMRPNRFYDSRYEKINPVGMKKVKEKRKKYNEKNQEKPSIGLRNYHQVKHRNQVTKTLERKLENDS